MSVVPESWKREIANNARIKLPLQKTIEALDSEKKHTAALEVCVGESKQTIDINVALLKDRGKKNNG